MLTFGVLKSALQCQFWSILRLPMSKKWAFICIIGVKCESFFSYQTTRKYYVITSVIKAQFVFQFVKKIMFPNSVA